MPVGRGRRGRVILLRPGLGADLPFTLAHELALCLLGHSGDTPANEAAADAYAVQLLAAAGGAS
jgi:hypothetical protein